MSVPHREHSPPPPPRREEERDRFSRANFGPLPKRHDADLLAHNGADTYIPPTVEPVRHREPIPVRERDLVGGATAGSREFREDRTARGDDRGRRPPPHWEEEIDRPKRRRSPSPSFPSHRTRQFSPERSHHPYSLGAITLPDPASLAHQLTFKQFAEWFRMNHPSTAKADEEEFRRYKEGTLGLDVGKERVGMGRRYERYRKEYTSRQLFSLYLMHRSSPWFIERYSNLPEEQAERKRINRQGRVPNVLRYIAELKAGKHDSVTFDQSDDQTKRPGASRRYSELEEPEGLDRGLGESTTDESGRLEIPPLPNQIFIKSVPPTIGRKELEDLFASCDGFQYLALTEPSVKKAFHRVAWAQYADGTDVGAVVKKLDESKIAGFVFHMGLNTAGTIGRLKYAPAVSNSLERLLKDCEKAKSLAIKLEDELLETETEPGGDVQMGKEAKAEKSPAIQGLKERGSVAVQEAVEKILEKEGLSGEDVLSDEQNIKQAKISLDHWISYLRHGLSTCYYCVAPSAYTEELQRTCVGHLRSPAPPTSKDQGLGDVPEEHNDIMPNGDGAGDEQMKESGANLAEKESEGVDDRREQGGGAGDRERGRGARDDGRGDGRGRQTSDERWEEQLDHKLGAALGGVDVVEYGGRDIDEETKKLTAPLIKQEEVSKYRCKECSKLFKAPEFVMKHILIKHGETFQGKLDDFAVFNNFVLDPQHLQPTQQVPAAIDDELPQLTGVAGAPLMNPSLAFNPDLMPGSGAASTQQQQQQMMLMMMQMQQAMMMQMQANGANGGGAGVGGRGMMGSEGRGLADRVGGYAGGYNGGGRGGERNGPVAREPLPPPPPGAEDPRARKGRVSYMDLDEMGGGGGGDGGLPY